MDTDGVFVTLVTSLSHSVTFGYTSSSSSCPLTICHDYYFQFCILIFILRHHVDNKLIKNENLFADFVATLSFIIIMACE